MKANVSPNPLWSETQLEMFRRLYNAAWLRHCNSDLEATAAADAKTLWYKTELRACSGADTVAGIDNDDGYATVCMHFARLAGDEDAVAHYATWLANTRCDADAARSATVTPPSAIGDRLFPPAPPPSAPDSSLITHSSVLSHFDPMPFGKHRGTPMREVPGTYLMWIRGQPWAGEWPQVIAYIEAHIDTVLPSGRR
jgi:hypothetical protein